MTIVLSFTATVHDGCENEFEQIMTELAPIMRAGEPDLLEFFWGSAEEPSTYSLVEIFKDQAALDYHRSSPHEKAFGPRLIPIIKSSHKAIFSPR